MSTKYLRDAKGKTIGILKQQGGMIRLFNRDGKLMGWYNTRTDSTYSASGSLVAQCNILVSLLNNK